MERKEIKSHIVELLKSYPVLQQKIALLRHEFEHPPHITDEEMLDAMAFSRGGPGGRKPIGHVSDKTFHIAVNYHGQAYHQNKAQLSDIVSELERLEEIVFRLEYCISRLPQEQRVVLQSLYFEQDDQKNLVSKLNLSDSTIRRYRDKGVEALTEMYMTLIKAGARIQW